MPRTVENHKKADNNTGGRSEKSSYSFLYPLHFVFNFSVSCLTANNKS